jgi:hypothetical protein
MKLSELREAAYLGRMADTRNLARLLAFGLMLGTVLLGAAAALHPVLQGDAASHLTIIARAGHWRAVHFAMLAFTALILVGIWVRLLVHEGPAIPLTVALLVISLGLAVHSLNIAYMAGAGWQLAIRFAAGDPTMAALYDVTHPIGLMASRYGVFVVALGAGLLGWAEWHDPKAPRYLAWLAWTAALAGMLGVGLFHESTPWIFAGLAVLALWQLATAWRVLRGDVAAPPEPG